MRTSTLIFANYSDAARAERYFGTGIYYAGGRSMIIKVKTPQGCGYGVKAFWRDVEEARMTAKGNGLNCIGVK